MLGTLTSRRNATDATALATFLVAVLVLCVASYLFGAEARAKAQQQLDLHIAAVHASACGNLGKPTGSTDHQACLATLAELRGEHERLVAAQAESIL